ncbi:MAG: hypothetical protein E6K44_12885 [Gammaproteobacteria bacterium]|nr:MAG: hypothetical protein E6K44_12885 [Gammaproteobacteria bacterium]
MDPQPLAGRTIAVPETRELEVFAAMLERRGASVVRCPLVAIRDAPRRVGVQLYGTEPNTPLVEFLERAGATVRCVAPYVYADAADDAAVQGLIARLSAGEVDAIAFTSTPQVERLFAVAPAATVCAALGQTLVAAVGPVVAGALERHGVSARLMPEESFFLKPLTTVLEEALGART